MAIETLAVPEDRLREVIAVIRAGLKAMSRLKPVNGISAETREQLKSWCDREEEYLEGH